MVTNLDYINQICIDLGGVGGHFTNLSGENEMCTLLGGTGGHFREIDALNEICTIQSVTAGHSSNLNALNAIAGVTKISNFEAWKYVQEFATLNYPDNAVVTTTNGNYIVSVDGKFILTVEGFVPLNAMITLQGNPVVTKNNEYITI